MGNKESRKQDNMNKGTRKNTKKRHRFLKFVMFMLVCFLVYKSLTVLFDDKAQEDMDKFSSIYPFKFQEDNSMNYVTDNFELVTSYELDGKTYNVNWKSSSKLAKINSDGQVEIQRPKDESVNVTLTEEYKRYFGKATKEFVITLISTNSLEEDDFEVISVESIKNGTYDEEMQLEMTPDNKVKSMYGEFKDTYIYSKEDALAFVIAYKEELGINKEVEFMVSKVDDTDYFRLYTLDAYYEGVKLTNSSVMITVDKNNFEVIKITNNVFDNIEEIDNSSVELNYENIISEYLNINKNDLMVIDNGKCIYENSNCENLVVYTMNSAYNAYVSNKTGKVLYCKEEVYDFSLVKKNMVDCNGKDENSKDLKFKALMETVLTNENYYYLKDEDRDIHVFHNYGNFDLFNQMQEEMKKEGVSPSEYAEKHTLKSMGAMIDYLYNNKMNCEISSVTSTFKHPVGVETYVNMQKIYDYYVKTFNKYSFDGNNAPIVVYTNNSSRYDNASWNKAEKAFTVYPAKKYGKTFACSPEVIAHEYTHAVFGQYLSSDSGEANEEIAGINEGYADVFGCLSSESKNWKIGKNTKDGKTVYIRDLANYSGDNVVTKCSEKYKDDIWVKSRDKNGGKAEEHVISVLISHIGYEMHNSKLFSDNDVAKIFYNSLTFGFNSSSTMVDARRNLIQAAEKLGYNKEQLDFIAYQFDLEEIYDGSYKIVTEEFMTEETPTDTENMFMTANDSIDDDILLDDTKESTFLVAFSPLGIVFSEDKTIYVYQSSSKASQSEIKEANKRINDTIGKEVSNDLGLNIKFEYHQYPKALIDFFGGWALSKKNEAKDFTYNTIEMTRGEDKEIDSLFDFIFDSALEIFYNKQTPYDFWNSFV